MSVNTFFEIDLFSTRRRAAFIYTPVYILFLILLTNDKMHGLFLLHLFLIIVISSILGFYNIKYFSKFIRENKEIFDEVVKTNLDYIEQQKGVKNSLKLFFSIRNHVRGFQISHMRDKALSKTRWKSRLFLILYSLPIFLIFLHPFSASIKPGYFFLYPLLLFLVANNFFWIAGYIYWIRKLKVDALAE